MSNVKLSSGEKNLLLGLIEENEANGVYYGNQKDYANRLKIIKDKILNSNERKSVSDNEHTQEECHVAYCKNPLYKEIYCKAHYKQKYGAL